MLYYISNQQYNLCHGLTSRSLQIDDTNLAIGNYLYKVGGTVRWLWTELKALDTSFSTSTSFSLSPLNDTTTILVKEDIANGYALILEVASICPTRTPTASITPSNSPTVSPTRTPTQTPTNTLTPTVTPSSPLNRYLYYISSNIENVCYNRAASSVNPISLYDINTTLEVGSYLYKNSNASSRWLFSELVAKIGSSSQFYFIQATTGLLSTVISGTGGYAIVSEAGITCPSMLLSNDKYSLCHSNLYVSIQVSTKSLALRSYIYKTNGIDYWTWTELMALDPLFDGSTHLYLKRIDSSSIIRINQDIATDYAVITDITSICPTQTPTNSPTNTPTNTITNTITPSNTSTPTNTVTPTNTLTPSVTPTNSPTNTKTNTPTPSNSPTLTPSNTATPTNTPSETPTYTPTKTPTSSITPSRSATPTNTPTRTPTPTDLLDGAYYLLSSDSYNICHSSSPIKMIVIYDADGLLNPGEFLYQTSIGDDKWTYQELLDLLGLGSSSSLYVKKTINDIVYTIVSDGNGDSIIDTISICITPTPTPTNTNTPTLTSTLTPTQTPTNTVTSTLTPTNSKTPTRTLTPTQTPTPTNTTTQTPTPTNTETPTNTPSETPTNTPTPTNTATNTLTPSNTATNTPTNTLTVTNTMTPSQTSAYIYKAINMNINRIIIGHKYKIDLSTDDIGLASVKPSQITFTGTYDPQRIAFQIGFSAELPTVILSAKITDLDTGLVEYNTAFVKCNGILDCY